MGCLTFLLVLAAGAPAAEAPAAPAGLNQAARLYLNLLENFAGFAEQHWNEKTQSYDAKGTGVTWARGNGGVALVNAVLLTEFPDRATFCPQRIPRNRLLEHTRRAIRTLCLTSRVSTDSRATRPGAWGGRDARRGTWHWQAGLETEHWVVAARLLETQLDDDTKGLVRQVATAEADAAIREIPSARPGDTAADDCCWNAGVLGVCAAIYADDPRASRWDEWAKRWALNTESRATDRDSRRMIDGKALGEWLVSTNVFPDLTLENHGFWDLPYQTCFAALIEPIVAHRICGRKIPEAFYANAREEGDEILRWLVLPDGDLLCPQGIDWAERDVQHSWAFTELVDHPFRWVQIEHFISRPDAQQVAPGMWVVDGRLRLHILGGAPGELAPDGINGSARRDFSAKAGEVLQESVCLYQALIPGRTPLAVEGGAETLRVGNWTLRRAPDSGWVADRPPR